MLRWRIERDYQELKQEIGLGHYEGCGWRGFHHHATLRIAAYGLFDRRMDDDFPLSRAPYWNMMLRGSEFDVKHRERHFAEARAA